MNVNHLKAAMRSSRPPFLILTPVCILLGLSIAFKLQGDINTALAWLILIGATCAHISVNMLNEYFDYQSGLDLATNKTPFSGGSGALPNQPQAAKLVLSIGSITFLMTAAIGLYLITVRGNLMLPIGVIGLVVILTYTQWINRIPILCLLAPGLGFGLLMVVGTQVVITGEHSKLAWLIALIPFFLTNNLLLLNQYPDITADASIGRRTMPIVYGVTVSNLVYALFAASSYGLIVLYCALGFIPMLSLIAIIPVVGAAYALWGAIKYRENIGQYPQYLAANVAAAILTPMLLGITIFMA